MTEARNHHVVPRLYLAGFCEDERGKYIYEYSTEKTYSPPTRLGRQYDKNPQHLSIKGAAGIIRDEYSFTNVDGTVNLSKVEERLARLEDYSTTIVKILQGQRNSTNKRSLSPLSIYQKATFSVYINLMVFRTPHGRAMGEQLWRENHLQTAFEQHRSAMAEMRDFITEKNIDPSGRFDHLILEFEKHRHSIGHKGPSYNTLSNELMIIRGLPPGTVADFLQFSDGLSGDSLPDFVRTSNIVNNIHFNTKLFRRMRWTYLMVPSGSVFVTSDSPVACLRNVPLWHSQAELTFPVSKTVAIYCSWHQDLPEGYLIAKPDVVGEINRRTMSNANMWVFASRDSQGIVDAIALRHRPQYSIYERL
ncbi:DUF4238 domain-containing protein [Capsulimonas corticalis]|uniref:DUF4238 domain-containing protein n=1 Tax=Capsulimonas corticalis TaxID=2219043 RepID=UPI000E6468D3|nr:DUF4238 domain-containing protein [Capsulimonas corticalis]